MMRRPPGRDLSDAADQQRIGGAFAALQGKSPAPAGGGAPPEQQEDALLAELEQLVARQAQILEQLKAIQQQQEGPAAPQDAGSPSAQGMP